MQQHQRHAAMSGLTVLQMQAAAPPHMALDQASIHRG
jgi:hypothetical protein